MRKIYITKTLVIISSPGGFKSIPCVPSNHLRNWYYDHQTLDSWIVG